VAQLANTSATEPARASERALSDARARIAQDEHHAWVALAADELLSLWEPQPGPLAGLAFGVKDIIDLAGMPTRCGSEVTSAAPATRSASLVRRLMELGAVPAGKTVTTEFAYFRPGPTRNPRAPGHTPGGSSSGSAAAVAAGHVPFALGSQTAGSLTRPAAYCGVAGLVLSHGAVALDGFSALAPSLDSAGVLASSAAMLDRVHAALFPDRQASAVPTAVLLWSGEELDAVSPEMSAAVERAGRVLQDAGLRVQPLEAEPLVAELAVDHAVVMAAEAARARPELLAIRERLSPALRELLEAGAAVPDRAYREALDRTRASRERFAALLDGAVVLGPAAPGAAPAGLTATGSPVMSRPWQLLGLPQLSVPGAADAAGLPLGVQLVAAHGEETTLLALGRILEESLASL